MARSRPRRNPLIGLERYIPEWVISGEAGVRKPEPGISAALLEHLGAASASLLLVDDRVKNLDAARQAGLRTVLLGPPWPDACHPQVASLTELAERLTAFERG